MAGSWFTARADTVFASGSNNFSTLISAHPTNYGLSAPQAAAFATKNTTFQGALVTATEPSTRTKGTVNAKNISRDDVRQMASELAKLINGTSTVTQQQKIDLGLAIGAAPTPMPPLGRPSDFKAAIELASGALDLSWKCTNPRGASGATYQIWRRIGATGQFEYLIGTGGKKYTDGSIPAGSAQVQYKIQAVRSTSVGPVAQFIVNFGAGGSTSVTETSPVKMAA